MSKIRKWFLLLGAVFSVIIGTALGIAFMSNTVAIFNDAITSAGSDTHALVNNLAIGFKGVLGWIVFGITMTNAMIVSSTLSVVMMVGENSK